MLSVTTALPSAPSARPPIILVHGAANSAVVWTFWQRELADRGIASHAIDLRGHGASAPIDLSRTSMHDYASDVRSLIAQLAEAPVVAGWSMGGLVAMMAAENGGIRACIGLAPSTPVRERDGSKPLRTGEFDAAEYGITSDDPDDQRAMPDLTREERVFALASLCRESRYARDERGAGIVVDALPCPLLIITGTADRQWPRDKYDGLHLPADAISVDGASHWGLVLSQRAIAGMAPRIVSWLDANIAARA